MEAFPLRIVKTWYAPVK